MSDRRSEHDTGPWFLNKYCCEECNEEWHDEWSCMCDDECPSCGKDFTPYESEDLSHVE